METCLGLASCHLSQVHLRVLTCSQLHHAQVSGSEAQRPSRRAVSSRWLPASPSAWLCAQGPTVPGPHRPLHGREGGRSVEEQGSRVQAPNVWSGCTGSLQQAPLTRGDTWTSSGPESHIWGLGGQVGLGAQFRGCQWGLGFTGEGTVLKVSRYAQGHSWEFSKKPPWEPLPPSSGGQHP